MSVADNIKVLRKRKKMTQEDLAKKSGLNIGTIRGYEQGKYEPKKEALYKLRKALDCNINEILDEPFQNPDENNAIIFDLRDIDIIKRYNLSFDDFTGFKNHIVKSIINEPLKLVDATDEPILELFHSLNDVGQDKALEQLELLAKIPEYQKKEEK